MFFGTRSFVDEVHGWLHRTPGLCNMVNAPKSLEDDRGGAASGSAIRGLNGGSGGQLAEYSDEEDHEDEAPDDEEEEDEEDQSRVEDRKKEMEDQLQAHMKEIEGQRREELCRLDFELAEAVEAIHLETVKKANEKVRQHKEAVAALEDGEDADEESEGESESEEESEEEDPHNRLWGSVSNLFSWGDEEDEAKPPTRPVPRQSSDNYRPYGERPVSSTLGSQVHLPPTDMGSQPPFDVSRSRPSGFSSSASGMFKGGSFGPPFRDEDRLRLKSF